MGELARIGVAIDEDLLQKFDELNGRRGYTNRSEAFRDLIRDALIQEKVGAPESEVVGTLTLKAVTPVGTVIVPSGLSTTPSLKTGDPKSPAAAVPPPRLKA